MSLTLLVVLINPFYFPLLCVCRKYGKDLKVDVSNPCLLHMGSKERELHFQQDQVTRPQLRKSNAQNLILFWPSPR